MAADRHRWAWFAAGLVLLGIGVALIVALVGWESGSPSTSVPPTSSPPTTDPRLTRLTAKDFSIDYPRGWSVVRIDHIPAGADYLDTTIHRVRGDSDHLIRVDVLPGGEPRSVADDAIESLRDRGDFTLRRDERVRLQTRGGEVDAISIEFDLGDIRSTDVFFADPRGRVFAVLTRTPAAEHDRWAGLYAEVRRSLRVTT